MRSAAIVVVDREDGAQLTADDQAEVAAIAEGLNEETYQNLGTATATPPSPNGQVQAIFVTGQAGQERLRPDRDRGRGEDARRPRAELADGTDLRVGLTGSAAQSLDSQESSEKALAVVSW